MASLLASITDNLIALGLISVSLFILKRKQAEEPDKLISGIPIKTFVAIGYAGIAIEGILLLRTMLTAP